VSAPIRIGTRASALALTQTEMVAEKVRRASHRDVEIVRVTTEGDTSRASLSSLGGTGVFATALRDALKAGECDLVVHSFKDLPTAAAPGLRIGAIPKRVDARDALIARDSLTLKTLPEGARVGTGSPRRVAQLRAARPDLDIRDIRGNIDTRIGFVTSGELDAVVLAAAGLTRLGRLDVVTEFFELDAHPTAPAQGALALEGRDERDPGLDRVFAALEHAPSRQTATAERSVLARLEAGCAAPVGATAMVDSELLLLTAVVYSIDGSQRLSASHGAVLEGSPAERERLAAELGERAAEELLEGGAAELAPLS
jgi:hydroxymethylbilane synthase